MSDKKKDPCGFYHGMTYDKYVGLPGLRHSEAKKYERSPSHALWAMTHPEADTRSTLIGSALHCAVLEPEEFLTRYVPTPKIDKRTKKGKAEWARLEQENPDAILLPAGTYDEIVAMQTSVLNHPMIQQAQRSVTPVPFPLPARLCEVSVVWRGPLDVVCKARIDWVVRLFDSTVVFDVKTTRDASPSWFAKQIHMYSYHTQAASYLHGLQVLRPGPRRRFVWIAVENQPPYEACLYEASEGLLQQGFSEWRRWVAHHARCVETGKWPGYPEDVLQVDLPRWAWKEFEEDENDERDF